ncbi:MAG: SpoVA/SpoVAEb family sporulation membrane protein [Clostridia bacterium]|nr:SpoVA/SpoVAEb family sporulation membrane protein [Clostridia bacterium]
MQDKESRRNQRYENYVAAITPKTGTWHSLFNSFWIGGLTCLIAQIIGDIYYAVFPYVGKDLIVSFTSMTIIAIAILFTGLGFFDVIARKGGAGSFLPITGFANAMASASMEFKTEGLIMGTSVKMFTVVGPVVVNGIVWSAVAAIINLLITGGV